MGSEPVPMGVGQEVSGNCRAQYEKKRGGTIKSVPCRPLVQTFPPCLSPFPSVWCLMYSGAKKVFSQPPIVQVLPSKKDERGLSFSSQVHFNYDRQNEKKNPENHIVGFLMNLFANYGGK